MRPQSAKAKGRRLQQEIVADILETFPHLTPDDVRSTSMGASGEDILLSTAARRVFPYDTEAGNQERINIWEKIAQAEARVAKRPTGGIVIKPLVVFRRNHTPKYAVIPWDHFLELIKPDGILL